MSDTKPENMWKDFEKLIYDIYKKIAPLAEVKHNDFIEGYESKIPRQIDISVRTKIANHEILLIIQAKNIKRKADVKVLDEFDSVIRDTRASKGILICNKGFTKSAKEYAKRRKIELCSAHDASVKEWQTEIQVPVIKTGVKVNVTIHHHYIPLKPTTIEGIEMPFPDLVIKGFLEKWEGDELDKQPGTHYLSLDKDLIKFSNSFMELKTEIEYTVAHRYHFKFFKPTDYRGIKDYFTENFTPAFIEFKEAIPYLNDGTWDYVPSLKEISIQTSHLQIEIIDMDLLKKKMIRIKWENKP